MDLLYRFLIGGAVVSLFAVSGDVLKPKSFAGLFGAAPSVALATLALTVHASGRLYAAIEAKSMIVGAIAFFVYARLCTRLMAKNRLHAATATISGLLVWLICALSAWFLALR